MSGHEHERWQVREGHCAACGAKVTDAPDRTGEDVFYRAMRDWFHGPLPGGRRYAAAGHEVNEPEQGCGPCAEAAEVARNVHKTAEPKFCMAPSSPDVALTVTVCHYTAGHSGPHAWERPVDSSDAASDGHDHKPVQHRDGKPPWCRTCGLTAAYAVPVSKIVALAGDDT